MEQHILAESHSSLLGGGSEGRLGVLVGIIVEVPSTFGTPSEHAIVKRTLVTGIKGPGRDVMAGYIGMLELFQQLTRERGGADENDLFLAL